VTDGESIFGGGENAIGSEVMLQIDVRQVFQPDILAGTVSLERLTYVRLSSLTFWPVRSA
jgi:hypothetical protein